MSRNGSGVYSLPSNSWNPAVNSTPATAADWQALINDVAAALTQSLSKDGQTPITGNLAMSGNKITGLAAATASGDALRFDQLYSQGALISLASAATIDIGAQLSTMISVTGTTGITSFGANFNGPRFLIFAGALTLTHSASLALPGAANITTAAGDALIAVPISGGWRVVAYQRAAALPAIAGPLASSGITGAAASGANSDITSLTGLTTGISGTALGNKIQPITASVAANALTITLNPTTLDFRSATLTSGTVNTRAIASAISLTISSGSTLGTVSAQQSRIAVLAIDYLGAVELAAVNIAGGNDLSETGLITTTAEGGAGGADTANVIYSTTSRASVPYRVVGYVESTQATAGTWATAPSTIQGYGGQALAAMSSLGYGQTWQNVTGSRTNGTTYYNTTGKPILVCPALSSSAGSAFLTVTVNGVSITGSSQNGGVPGVAFVIVPDRASYSASIPGFTGVLNWAELR